MPVLERRSQPRLAFTIDAAIFLGGRWRAGALVDFSLNGALFALAEFQPAADGKSCLLRLPCCRKLFNGLVVHSRDRLVGVKFIGVGQAECDALQGLSHDMQGDASLLDRDIGNLFQPKPA